MDDDDDFGRHSTAELMDMVDGDGFLLGSLPRPYAHDWNILHHGVSVVVARGDADVL